MNALSFYQSIMEQPRAKELLLMLAVLKDSGAGWVERADMVAALPAIHPSNISRGYSILEGMGLIEVRREKRNVAFRLIMKTPGMLELAA